MIIQTSRVETFWQPCNNNNNNIKISKPVERFTIECLKSEVFGDYRFSIYPWKHKESSDKIFLVLYNLEQARKMIKRIQSVGFIAKRDWVE